MAQSSSTTVEQVASGLVTDVTLDQIPEGDCSGLIEALHNNPSVQNLTVALSPPPVQLLLSLKSLLSLRSFQAASCQLSSTLVRHLTLPVSLLELNLAHNPLGPRGAQSLATLLSTLHSLEQLNVADTSLGHFGAQALARGLPTSLKKVNISANAMGHDGVWKLAAGLGNLTQLQLLDLSHNAVADDGCLEIANRLTQWPYLQVLNLSHNEIGTVGLESLAQSLIQLEAQAAETSGKQPPLNEIDLSYNPLCAFTALAKALAKTDYIQTLHLQHTGMGDDDAILLAEALLESKSMQYLDLSSNNIGDLGAGAFVEHLDMLSIETLKLENNTISEARRRILDMLLKHRQSIIAPPVSPPTSTHSRRHVDSSDDEDNSLLDQDKVEQARELLAAFLESHDEGDHVALPADYVGTLTHHYDPKLIDSYGAFGPLYLVTVDGDEDVQTTLAIRRIVLGSPGPLKVARDTIVEDLLKLRHENVLPILSLTIDKACVVVYNVSHLQTLTTLLQDKAQKKVWTWKHRIHLVSAAAKALLFLHTGGSGRTPSFHGDLRPSNIFVSHDFVKVQLSDAMLSRLIATDRQRFASGDVVFGSRSYRCPRYERGVCHYDAASDIFSFGVVLSEVVTGVLQRSKTKGPYAYDVYYDIVLAKQGVTLDPMAGSLTKAALESLLSVMFSCINPSVKHRPSALTVVEILGQLNL